VWHNTSRLSEEQFPPVETQHPLRRMTWSPARCVVKLRCYLLSLLRIDHPDCERCNARETSGDEMRRRLEELNWRTQPDSLSNGGHEEVLAVFDSKPDKVAASPRISSAQRKKVA